MGQFFKDHFDKFLLSWFLGVFLLIAAGMAWLCRADATMAAKYLDWITREFDIFSGALIGLITGAAAGAAGGLALGLKLAQPSTPSAPTQPGQ